MLSKKDFEITDLGQCEIDTPLLNLRYPDGGTFAFTDEPECLPSFERAGARRKIFFNPEKTTVGVVTCGGVSARA